MRSNRAAVPPGSDSGKERRGPLNYSQYVVSRVIEMPTKRVPQAPKPRTWRVSLIKKKMEYVGRVQAVDKASAELAAAEFELTDHQRTRIFVEEVPV